MSTDTPKMPSTYDADIAREPESEPEYVTIRITVSYGWAGCDEEDTFEVLRSEWDAMDDEARDAEVDGYVETMISNRVSAGWEVVEDEG
jgi:hypothetical protein